MYKRQGEIYEVWLEVATYPADKNIKVCVFTEKEEEIWKLFELTTDMGIPDVYKRQGPGKIVRENFCTKAPENGRRFAGFPF